MFFVLALLFNTSFFVSEGEARIAPQNLQASFVNVSELWERFFGEKKRNVWQTFETFRMKEDTKKEFRQLHTNWQEMLSFWVAQKVISDPEYPEDFYYEPGISFASGQNYDQYARELQASLLLIQDINKQLQEDLRLSYQICDKQKSSVKCP